MNIVEIVVAILISWGIIILFNIVYRRSTRSAILDGFRFAGAYPHDDEQARALTTVPLSSDIRISHLWQAMDFHERLAWHTLMHTLEDEQQKQDKEEAKLSNYDRSTEHGEDAFLQATERLENRQQRLLKHASERIDFSSIGLENG